MTLETVIAELKVMFPKGIPNSASEVFAHQDAPVKSYQELRKLLGRSPAFTNRSNWKMLLAAAEEGGEVEPPKKKLSEIITKTILEGFTQDQVMFEQDFAGDEKHAVLTLVKLTDPSVKDNELDAATISPLSMSTSSVEENKITLARKDANPRDTVVVTVKRVDINDIISGATLTLPVPAEDWENRATIAANHFKRVVPATVVQVTEPISSVVISMDPDNEFVMQYNYDKSNVVFGKFTITLQKEEEIVPTLAELVTKTKLTGFDSKQLENNNLATETAAIHWLAGQDNPALLEVHPTVTTLKPLPYRSDTSDSSVASKITLTNKEDENDSVVVEYSRVKIDEFCDPVAPSYSIDALDWNNIDMSNTVTNIVKGLVQNKTPMYINGILDNALWEIPSETLQDTDSVDVKVSFNASYVFYGELTIKLVRVGYEKTKYKLTTKDLVLGNGFTDQKLEFTVTDTSGEAPVPVDNAVIVITAYDTVEPEFGDNKPGPVTSTGNGKYECVIPCVFGDYGVEATVDGEDTNPLKIKSANF